MEDPEVEQRPRAQPGAHLLPGVRRRRWRCTSARRRWTRSAPGTTETWTKFEVPDEAVSVGFTEAVRGVLSHHMVIKKGKIANYHPYPPTPWNGSVRDTYGTPGPYEDAVQNTPIFEENPPDNFKGIDIMRAVRSFDPCLPCGVHMYTGGGKVVRAAAHAVDAGEALLSRRRRGACTSWRITQDLVDLVAERTAGRQVVAVNVRVGDAAGVVPDAMAFASTWRPARPPLEGARLVHRGGRRATTSSLRRRVRAGPKETVMCVTCAARGARRASMALRDGRRRCPRSRARLRPPRPAARPRLLHARGARAGQERRRSPTHVRESLAARRVTAVNLMSSPGAGKTSLLERTIAELRPRREVCVIEGDQETSFDADRIRAAGARAVQVNTGAGCHLDADDGAPGAARPRPARRLAAVRRERRQPGVPGAVRPRRARARSWSSR